MTFVRLGKGDIEQFTVATTPSRSFSSSSSGVTGSVYVYPRRSTTLKDTIATPAYINVAHDDSHASSLIENVRLRAKFAYLTSSSPVALTASANFPSLMQSYLDKVDSLSQSSRNQQSLQVNRFTPGVTFDRDFAKKLVIKNQLSQFYRVEYPSAHWAYTNYNCYNFFTGSTVPDTSCLIYPNVSSSYGKEGHVSGTYVPSGAISFDFFVNPHRKPDQTNGQFKAGTLFHLSSTYALSIVSGSLKDVNGKPSRYRLLLQLSHSADVQPSMLVAGSQLGLVSNQAYHSGGLLTKSGYSDSNLAFFSDDNCLSWNKWHHVVVRWGTNAINGGSGSFVVDGVERGTFCVPSSTIAPEAYGVNGPSNPDALIVGNYYNGRNSGSVKLSQFFAADPALRDGLVELNAETSIDGPPELGYTFNHQLNAQVHDLMIKRYYMSHYDIEQSSSIGMKSIDRSAIAFYSPPFFRESSPIRRFVGTHGGIPQTPFFEADGTTQDPFNVALAFGVNGHYINLENYTYDFASQVHPRLHHMTATMYTTTTSESREANAFLYDQAYVRRRNTLILPCDDGLHVPSFELLSSESLHTMQRDDTGVRDYSVVYVGELISTSSLLFGTDFDEDTSFVDQLVGATPESPGLSLGSAMTNYVRSAASAVSAGQFDYSLQQNAPLTLYQRTRDASSNQVTFFDISNLFYGKRIYPGTLTIVDTTLSGTSDQPITLKDDGRGGIYRADCLSSASTWNNVGTVFYNEGIIAIKNPHLYFFGKEQFQISFKGEQNVHVMSISTLAPANTLNSSSNPNYVKVPASPFANDPEKEFVYISNINFHDKNFNVVMKTQLAQPIQKRPGESLLFKCKIDL